MGGYIMLDVSVGVLQDSILALESRLFEIERNNRIHRLGISEDNIRTMFQVLRTELLSRNSNKL